jgi:hypothetical protein
MGLDVVVPISTCLLMCSNPTPRLEYFVKNVCQRTNQGASSPVTDVCHYAIFTKFSTYFAIHTPVGNTNILV